jgi:hypothetical protein
MSLGTMRTKKLGRATRLYQICLWAAKWTGRTANKRTSQQLNTAVKLTELRANPGAAVGTVWSRMQHCPSSEADSSSDTQQLTSEVCNMKVHYRVHNSPSLVPILSQMNPVNASHSISLTSTLISFHLRVRLPSGPFPSRFPTKTLHSLHFFPTRAICPAHHNFLIWSHK